MLKPTYIICHYGEIALKGKNREQFERQLISNIKRVLSKYAPGSFESIRRISGAILIKLGSFNQKRTERITQALKETFGIVYFAWAVFSKQGIEEIRATAKNLLETRDFQTFRITAKRSNKKYYLTSQEVNARVGEHVRKGLKKTVCLDNPQETCFIEIIEKQAFLYLEKIKGLKGLPVGISGDVAVMLSGGIDSPVAAFYLLKRGAVPLYIHFHAVPYTSPASIEKVRDIVKSFVKFQGEAKLFTVPFGDIQKEIMLKSPAKLRVILYRLLMFRIAQEIAKKEKALALITGESLGQVASQTLHNIKAVSGGLELPILRPLIGFDKDEIIERAKAIGTYDISIRPYEDCCSRFVPRHPETRAKPDEVKAARELLDVGNLIKRVQKKAKQERFFL